MTTPVILSGRGLLRQYNEYRAMGYTVLWRGNGRICMQPGGVPVKVVVVEEVSGLRPLFSPS